MTASQPYGQNGPGDPERLGDGVMLGVNVFEGVIDGVRLGVSELLPDSLTESLALSDSLADSHRSRPVLCGKREQ